MSVNSKLMEALSRIEHKLDLCLKRDQQSKVGDPTHVCPVCNQAVDYNVDIEDSVVIRKCGCKTGKIALDISKFAPPITIKKKVDDNDGTDEEDRNDANSRRSRSRSR